MSETYIYGSGRYGVLTLLDLQKKRVEIAGFIDNNKELRGKTKLGYRIFSINEALEKRREEKRREEKRREEKRREHIYLYKHCECSNSRAVIF